MLKGDLTTTPLTPLLIQLADDEATGCLHISDHEGDEALIYFRSGQVYAVSVPGRRPQLGAKLVSSGALAPEALAEALEAQRTELQGWRLGELLVHLGYVDQPVVEAFIHEQVNDALWDLIRWPEGRWRFRRNEKTREDVAPPTPVAELLNELRERGADWAAISAVVHGPTAVPMLSTGGGGAPEMTLDADAWSMLCKIDGERSVAELARDCGYTLFEAGQVLLRLVSAGLVDIEEDLEVARPATVSTAAADERYGAISISSALAAAADDGGDRKVVEAAMDSVDTTAQLARLVAEVAATVRDEALPYVPETPSHVPLRPAAGDQSFAASIARVSDALTNVLGPPPVVDDPFEVPAEFQVRRSSARLSPARRERTPETERRERLRAAAAAELAAAHALAEALRRQTEEGERPCADVVDLERVRRQAEARGTADREAVRVAAEEAAWAEHADREADREAARLAAEQEAAELAAAEEAAWAEHADREAAREAAQLAAELESGPTRIELAPLAGSEEASRYAAAREEFASATALLMELSTAPVEGAPDDASAVDEPANAAPVVAKDNLVADSTPVDAPRAEIADTAALLRELSSLGLEDDPPVPSPTPRPPMQRPAPTETKKKRRGLFGR